MDDHLGCCLSLLNHDKELYQYSANAVSVESDKTASANLRYTIQRTGRESRLKD